MTRFYKQLCFAAMIPFLSGASLSHGQARDQSQEESPQKYREDMHYVAILGGTLDMRSLETTTVNDQGNITGTTDSSPTLTLATLVVGGHISELFHTEFRLGSGVNDATEGDLTLSIDYFASWYMGIHYPLTDFINAYGQFGFTHLEGGADLDNPSARRNRAFRDIPSDFPESSFSMSWLLGLDLELMDNAYLVLEGGRLFKDTVTDVNAFQFSGGFRYEF